MQLHIHDTEVMYRGLDMCVCVCTPGFGMSNGKSTGFGHGATVLSAFMYAFALLRVDNLAHMSGAHCECMPIMANI